MMPNEITLSSSQMKYLIKKSHWSNHLCDLYVKLHMKNTEYSSLHVSEPFPNQQILNSSKLQEFADDNFKSNENGRKFSKWLENTVEKRRNCSLRAISPIPPAFSKDLYCRRIKSRTCLGNGYHRPILLDPEFLSHTNSTGC